MLLKFHSWIYRKFGVYTEYVKEKEEEYRKTLGNISDFEKDLMVSCWQALNGFYKTSKQMKRDLNKRQKDRNE